jgi:hypothetical protein
MMIIKLKLFIGDVDNVALKLTKSPSAPAKPVDTPPPWNKIKHNFTVPRHNP